LHAFEDSHHFVDAWLSELAHDAGCETTVTFDPRFAIHPKARLICTER
jgi:predicted nucleic-acid-binding protein